MLVTAHMAEGGQYEQQRDRYFPDAYAGHDRYEARSGHDTGPRRHAKDFYQRLGWRTDADIAVGDTFRAVQLTPPQFIVLSGIQ
jgi:hypothetical protein